VFALDQLPGLRYESWQTFCQQKRLEGVESFAEIARLWKKQKDNAPATKECRPRGNPRSLRSA
jgi:hypothetical protein